MVHILVAAVPSFGERSPYTLAPCSPGPFSLPQTGTALQRGVCHMLPLQLPCLNRVLSHGECDLGFYKACTAPGPTDCLEHGVYFLQKQFLEDDWASVAVVILGGGCLGLKTHLALEHQLCNTYSFL